MGKFSKFVVSNFLVTDILLPEIICPNMSKLTLCILCNFACFLSSPDFLSIHNISKNYYRNTVSGSNSLDPDEA